jgi:DNA-binding response OmpR family regulator
MVVDDEQDFREMINLMLLKEGFETKTVENGWDFLENVDDFQPDLVTLDVMMPGPTTSEILEKLKNKKTNPKIILITFIKYSKENLKRILERGNIVDYITKPINLEQLMNIIHKCVSDKVISA